MAKALLLPLLRLVSLLHIIIGVPFAAGSSGHHMKSLVVFGDSISDTGKGASLGGGPWPAALWDNGTYVERGSNGNWVNFTAVTAGLRPDRVHNYAVGGAAMCTAAPTASTGGEPWISLDQQLDWYKQEKGSFKDQGRVVPIIMIGR